MMTREKGGVNKKRGSSDGGESNRGREIKN